MAVIKKDHTRLTSPDLLVSSLAAPRTTPLYGRGRPRQRVVIIGCGFAGFSAAQELGRRFVPHWADVTVVDADATQLFTPLLYEAATGAILTERLQYPVGPDLKRLGIEFRQSTVEGIDSDRRAVILQDGEVGYDFLIAACGSHTNFYGHSDFASDTLPLKTAADADRLRQHIEGCIGRATHAEGEAERKRLLTFAIVGGGPTGVELAGSLHQASSTRLLPPGERDAASFRVLLIEARPTLLHGMPDPLIRAAAAELTSSGVAVWTDSAVEAVNANGLAVKGRGAVPAATVVWSAGIRASTLPGLETEAHRLDGRLEVDGSLRLSTRPEIYSIGDMAAIPWTERPAPANAPAAIQAGKAAARNVTRGMLGLPPITFRYEHPGDLLALGYHSAVAHIRGRTFTGKAAWLLRRGVYLSNLLGARNRVGLAADWLRDELAGRESVAR